MIRTSVEAARGCGYRVAGGLYLVSGELSEPCPRLPLPLDRCPHCGQGIGPARGWTWVIPASLFPAREHGSFAHNARCPLGADIDIENPVHRTGDRAGLIWVGEKFYSTPDEFMAEAERMGVSRRIKAIPHGFEIGRDWVYLGHRKAIDGSRYATTEELTSGEFPNPSTAIISPLDAVRVVDGEGERYSPGVITLFKPIAVEYIVKGTESEEELERLEERGIQLVKVVRDVEQMTAFDGEEPEDDE